MAPMSAKKKITLTNNFCEVVDKITYALPFIEG